MSHLILQLSLPNPLKPGGCFSNVSQALKNNLSKIQNIRNHIYGDNFKLKLCACAQSIALGTRTKFQLEIRITIPISTIHKFWENILESPQNVSETPPRCQFGNEDVVGAALTGAAPTTSAWSTILLPTKVPLILEVLQWLYPTTIICCDYSSINQLWKSTVYFEHCRPVPKELTHSGQNKMPDILLLLFSKAFYASSFRRRRHYVFGLSVRMTYADPSISHSLC